MSSVYEKIVVCEDVQKRIREGNALELVYWEQEHVLPQVCPACHRVYIKAIEFGVSCPAPVQSDWMPKIN